MTDFPKGGDVEATRKWLDKEGYAGFFEDWKADALLGTDKSDILDLVPGVRGLKLWGLLSTARSTAGNVL